MRIIKKQLLVLFVFSLLASVAAIIHGIYFNLDFSQIKRLTIEGLILTFLIVFPAVVFLEWVFDINMRVNINKINKRLNKLEKRKK